MTVANISFSDIILGLHAWPGVGDWHQPVVLREVLVLANKGQLVLRLRVRARHFLVVHVLDDLGGELGGHVVDVGERRVETTLLKVLLLHHLSQGLKGAI